MSTTQKIFPLFFIPLFLSHHSLAITIDQIPGMIKQSNRDLSTAASEVASAKEEEKVALARYFPKVEIKNAYTHLDHDIVLQIPAQRIEKNILGGSLVAGIDVNLPPVTLQKQDFAISQLVVTQPIYTGGRITAGMDAANAQRKEADLNYEHTFDEKLALALVRYFQAKTAGNVLEVLKDIHSEIDKLEEIANAAVKSGAVPKFSIYQIAVAKAELNARIEEAQAKNKLAALAFRALVGMNSLTPLSFDSQPIEAPLDVGLDVFKTKALSTRYEFGILESKATQVSALKNAKTGEMLPTVFAFGSREIYSMNLPLLTPKWAVGLGVDIPITAGLSQFPEREKAALLNEKIINLKLKAQEEIPLQVESFYVNCTSFSGAIKAIDEGIEMAKEAMRLATARFKSGTGSSVEVLKASTDLETTQVKRLLLIEEYNRNVIELYAASGATDDYLAAYKNNSLKKG